MGMEVEADEWIERMTPKYAGMAAPLTAEALTEDTAPASWASTEDRALAAFLRLLIVGFEATSALLFRNRDRSSSVAPALAVPGGGAEDAKRRGLHRDPAPPPGHRSRPARAGGRSGRANLTSS